MECRANRHMRPSFTDLGKRSGLVTVEYPRGETMIVQRCARRCGVRWLTIVDPFSGRLIGRARLDYSQAEGYLFTEQAGGDGFRMGKPEREQLSANLVHTALQKNARLRSVS
jgi:hypothetical protein